MRIARTVAVASCVVLLALLLGTIVGANNSAPPELGVSVSPEIARSLRGGDAGPTCCWYKSTECTATVNQANGSSCPATTYYYSDADGSEYSKGSDSDYCGTARDGSPGVYDCTSVVTETTACVK